MRVHRLALAVLALCAAVSVVATPVAWGDSVAVTATPDRNTDVNGWYNKTVVVTFTGTGTGTTCAPKTISYSGPDDPNATVSSTCTDTDTPADKATGTFHFSYDGTAPTVTAADPARQPDSNGWYNHSVKFMFHGTDATSGIGSCTTPTYSGPDGANATVTGACTDKAGNTAPAKSFPLQYDATRPTITAVPARPPDFNGWYNHPVTFTFNGTDATSGIASCTPTTTYSGPDSANATVTGACTDKAGNSTPLKSVPLKYDATPPTIRAGPARPPDFNGWYNHAVTFTFTGTDATSGLSDCPSVTYKGPDSASTTVNGSCTDDAGNSASLLVALRYHATPPSLNVTVNPGDRIVVLRWRTDVVSLEITRSPGLGGAKTSVLYLGQATAFDDAQVRDGVRYRYMLLARDAAGNVTTRSFAITPDPRLLSPLADAQMSAPPLLQWTPVRGASYYNVQLYRGPKVLSAWPSHARLKLASTWSFAGRHYGLKPGRYRWYVWPGFGPRAAARYGRAIGTRTFVVT